METLEIIGIILIFIGVVYIFLQGLGKLSDGGGEIETKILSLKGGAGLILVALGIVLLALGSGLLASLTGPLPLPPEVKIGTPTPTETSEPSMPTSQPLPSGVSPTPAQVMPGSKNIVLTVIDKDSGIVNSCGSSDIMCTILSQYNVGSYIGFRQAFLSFNIAGIPANATITNAKLDFSNYRRGGDPFSYYGCLGVYVQDYGAPDSGDFFKGTPTGAIVKWCSEDDLSLPSQSNDLMSALQSKLGAKRFQIRVQFDDVTGGENNYIDLDGSKLIITYTLP